MDNDNSHTCDLPQFAGVASFARVLLIWTSLYSAWHFACVSDVLCEEFWPIALPVCLAYAFKEENILYNFKEIFFICLL